MDTITLTALDNNLHFFHKLYDAVRLVDPVSKHILDVRTTERIQGDQFCYDYWQNGRVCSNCISVRAYHEQKCFVKLERHPDSIIMVTAIPLDNTSRPVVLELLKDATDSLMVSTSDHRGDRLVCNMISQLNEMVVHDALTNLFNRRYVDDQLPVEIVRAALEQKPLSLIFMDVNSFKQVNDTYGHVIGDAALREISHAIMNNIHSSKDWAARFGGDEFLLCLNNTDDAAALEMIHNLEDSIAKIAIPVSGTELHISASMGHYTMTDTPLPAEELIRLADTKMYENKKASTNATA